MVIAAEECSMGAVLIVVPVFALIAAGYAAVALRFISPTAHKGISEFAFSIAIPALLFRIVMVAEFPAVNAFAVWDVRPVGLRQVASVSEDSPSGDWRIEGWQGESCVRLSLVPIDRYPDDWRDMERTARDPWFAAQANGWKPAAGSCPRS